MFSELLKTLRQERGVSQTKLAKEVGVSPGNVGDWEIGRSKPGYAAIVELSRFFGVSADYLLGLTSDRQGVAGVSCDGVPLSPMENDLIAMLRLLPDDARKEIFDLVHFKYTRLAGGEKESIYWTYFDESDDEKSGPAQGLKAQGGTA